MDQDQPGRSRARTTGAKEAVRAKLVASARELFASADFAGASLRRIAAHAGYSPGTIYQYFPDRQALVNAVRDHDLAVGSSRVDLQACKLEYSIVSPK